MMSENKCPNCGHNVPVGSRFCNNCGASLVNEKECPSCHNMIPGDSIFCPVCREMVKKTPTTAPATDAWNPNTTETPTTSDTPATSQGEHKVRNSIIAIAIILFVGLVIVRQCYYSGDKRTPEEMSIASTTADDGNSVDIFNRTLEANNLKGDGDRIACAMRTIDEKGNPGDKIMGVTYLCDDLHSFYKVYTLTQNGSEWNIKLNLTKYINGRNLVFDRAELRSDEIPMIDNIGGKHYFYFAYANLPRNNEDPNGMVSAILFDIDDARIAAQLDYEGELVRTADGQPQVIGRNSNGGSGILGARLREHAQSIGYLHIPSQEEIDAERAEKAREEAEKLRADSIAYAREHNVEQVENLENGEEVTMNVKQYDKSKPLFRAEDFTKKINGPGYTVFLCKNGKVYAFNKASNSNFEVTYGGSNATDIGFEDSEKGIINVRTTTGKVQYNLNTHSAKKVN